MAPTTRSASRRAINSALPFPPPPTPQAPKRAKKTSSEAPAGSFKSMTSSWMLDPPARSAPPRQGPFVSFENSLHTFGLNEDPAAVFPLPPTSVQHQQLPAPLLPPHEPQITSPVSQQPIIRQNAEREPTPPSPATPTLMIPSGRPWSDLPASETRVYNVLAATGTKRKRDESPIDLAEVPSPPPPKRLHRATTPLPVDPEEGEQRKKTPKAKEWKGKRFERMTNQSESSTQGAAWAEAAHQSQQIHLGNETPEQVTTGIRQQKPAEIKRQQNSLRRFVTASEKQAEKFIARGKVAPEPKKTKKKSSGAKKTKTGPSQQQQNPPAQTASGENVRRSTRARKAPDRLDPVVEETKPPVKRKQAGAPHQSRRSVGQTE